MRPNAIHAPKTTVHPMFAHLVIGCSALTWWTLDYSGDKDEYICTFDANSLKKYIQDKQFVCSSPQANGLPMSEPYRSL
nr:hypothetical protein BgiMline_019914 [Biomphalaria glabrata]